jgi:hypothetical protein
MSIIHLVDIVKSAAAEKKTSRGEKIVFNTFDQSRLRHIEKAAQGGELKTATEILDRLSSEIRALKENFDRNDFRDLEEKIRRALR